VLEIKRVLRYPDSVLVVEVSEDARGKLDYSSQFFFPESLEISGNEGTLTARIHLKKNIGVSNHYVAFAKSDLPRPGIYLLDDLEGSGKRVLYTTRTQ
jgi:hypothetical protein